MNGYVLASTRQTENAAGKTLLPGVLVWRSYADLSAALSCSEPKNWNVANGTRQSTWQKQQLLNLYAEAGLTWEDKEEAIFLYRVRLRKMGQEEFFKHVRYAGGHEKVLRGWVTKDPVTIYSKLQVCHKRSLYGEADPHPSGLRFWARPFPFDDIPEDSSLVVVGPEIRGLCVFDLTTVYEDWTRTIPTLHKASRFAWDPLNGNGVWQKSDLQGVYKAHWEPIPTIFDKLIAD